MNSYLLLMHNDVPEDRRIGDWEPYIEKLRQEGHFEGGSAIGDGVCATKSRMTPDITGHLSGYVRIQAENLSYAKSLVQGNPVFEAGGTVEIRELPRPTGEFQPRCARSSPPKYSAATHRPTTGEQRRARIKHCRLSIEYGYPSGCGALIY